MKKIGASFEILIVSFLLLTHFMLSVLAVKDKSLTFDEPAHIVGGLDILINRSYSHTPDNGVLPQIVEAIPANFFGDFPVRNAPTWKNEDKYQVQKNVLFADFAKTDSIVWASRAAVALLSIFAGILVYLITRDISGQTAGLVSLLLFSFCPNMIAHSGLSTSDMLATSAFLFATWSFWKASRRLKIISCLFSGLALGILCVSKMSFFIMAAVYACTVFVRIASNEPIKIEIPGRKTLAEKQGTKLLCLCMLLLLSVVLAGLVVWAAYGFRYQATPGDSEGLEKKWTELVSKTGIIGKSVNFTKDIRIMPESFLYGFLSVYHYSRQRYSFMNGELSNNGFLMFFPYCFTVKTTLPMILILLLSAWILYACKRKNTVSADCSGINLTERYQNSGIAPPADGNVNDKLPRLYPSLTNEGICFHDRKEAPCNYLIYELSPYLIFVGIYFSFALSSKINIGHRHILPIYPHLFIISACALSALNGKFLKSKMKYLALFLLTWHAFEGVGIFPNYLAYFNQLAGGPGNAYRHLVDSSLDWGQDLKTLKKWIDEKPERKNKELYLSYFGADIPERFGINAKILPGYHPFDRENKFLLGAGYYAISATMLQFVYFPDIYFAETGLDPSAIDDRLYASVKDVAEKEILAFDHIQNPQTREYKIYNMLRFAKLCLYLRDKKPDATAGYSILIFDLGKDDIEKAIK